MDFSKEEERKMTDAGFLIIFLIVVIAISITAVIAVLGGLSSIFGAIANTIASKDEEDGQGN